MTSDAGGVPAAAQAASHDEHRDDYGAKLGMYLFLFTEFLLFGGMFLLYAVFRYRHAMAFHEAAADLNVVLGVVNTAVLLTSSLTMAISVAAGLVFGTVLTLLLLPSALYAVSDLRVLLRLKKTRQELEPAYSSGD